MKALAVALAAVLVGLVGCAGDLATGDDTCDVSLAYMPMHPVAAPDTEIRVDATLTGLHGVATFSWTVEKNGTSVGFAEAQGNASAITFLAPESGAYDVRVSVGACEGSAVVNVVDDTNTGKARLHITPPLGVEAPLVDRKFQVPHAMNYDMGPVVLDPGVIASGVASAPSYLQFRPLGSPDALVEAFTTSAGAYQVRLRDEPHEVTVIPMTAGLAPRKLAFDPSSPVPLQLDAGDTIAGTVKQGATPIASAKVQLRIDGVPTTIATTSADGSFAVHGVIVDGAMVEVEVTPAAGSGLSRLEVAGAIDLSGPLAVTYATIATRNLSGVPVRRAGAAQATKQVAIVGTVAGAGSANGVLGTGTFRAAATTDAAGGLPALLAPARPLSAVTTIAPGDVAVDAIDLTAGVPAAIDAPAMTAFSTQLAGGATALNGATLDVVPEDALAQAGIATLHFTADASGLVTGTVPAGATFDLRISDPAGRRAPVFETLDTEIAGSYTLPEAVYIKGTLTVQGSTNPIVGASVQILCADCTGLDRSRPIAEMASDPHGDFSLAVPDPGAM